MQRIAIGQRIRVIAKTLHAQAVGTVIEQSVAGGYYVRLDGGTRVDHAIFFYAEEVTAEVRAAADEAASL